MLPGFFGSLVFFCVPAAAGGYRTIKWALACFFLFWAAAALYRGAAVVRLPSQKMLVLTMGGLFVSLAVPSFFGSADPAVALAGISRYAVGAAAAVIGGWMWASCNDQQKNASLFALLLVAALSTFPLMISFAGMYLKGAVFEPDICGTFGNPNWAAGYLVTALPLGVYALTVLTGRVIKWIAGAALLLVLCGIGISLSKAGILTGIVILLISIPVLLSRRALIPCILVLGLPAALAVSPGVRDVLLLWLQPRLCIWQALLADLPDSLLIGNGALQALSTIERGLAYGIGGDVNAYMPSSQVDFVHNDYLQVLAEGGGGGLVSFLLLAGCTLLKAYRSARRQVHAAGLAFCALCINGLGESPLQVPVTFYAWWCLAGVIWCEDAAGGAGAVVRARTLKTMVLAFCALFLVEGARHALGGYFWTRSRDTTTLVQQKKHLQQAAFLLPEAGNLQTEYARALERSRQHAQARATARRAKAVKFDYDDLYIIAEADVALKKTDPVSAWQDISDRFPCLHYPRLKLAQQYLRQKKYAAARNQCDFIMSSACLAVNPGQPYAAQAERIIEMIQSAEHAEKQS